MADMISWANRLYSEGVDNKDATMFADAFTEEGWLRFGNNPPLIGRETIREAIAGFFTMFASLQHESAGTTYSNGTLVIEATVTYTLFNGGTVTVPTCTIFRFADTSGDNPLAHKCQIYVDLAPLFSAVQNVST